MQTAASWSSYINTAGSAKPSIAPSFMRNTFRVPPKPQSGLRMASRAWTPALSSMIAVNVFGITQLPILSQSSKLNVTPKAPSHNLVSPVKERELQVLQRRSNLPIPCTCVGKRFRISRYVRLRQNEIVMQQDDEAPKLLQCPYLVNTG